MVNLNEMLGWLKKKTIIWLLLILIFGLLLRVYKLTELPLYGDELTMVYDSYSLLKTGKDQLGNAWPINFSMGEGRPAGYVYASIPLVALFGPGVWGVRALSVLSGLGVIIVMYLVGKQLFSEKTGLVASFIASISMWEISLSRGGFEAHFGLFLALLGVWFFLVSRKKSSHLIWAVVAWGLAVHTYPTYRIVLPIFLPVMLYFVKSSQGLIKHYGRRHLLLAIFLFLFFTITSFQQTFSSSSIDRVRRLGVFSDRELTEKLVQKINYERSVNSLGNTMVLFHNKPIERFKVLVSNYLQNFSVQFLFLTGDGNPRHNMSEMGEFYWAEVLIMIAGLVFLITKEKWKELFLLIIWLLAAPLASAITGEPHALRSSFMLPPLILLSAVGIAGGLLLLSKHKIFTLALTFFWFFQFALYLERIYFLAPQKHGRFWSEMAKTVSFLASEQKGQYELVLLSDKIDNMEYAFQVYAQLDPREIIYQNQKPIEMSGVKELKRFGNVLIGQFPDTEVFINSLSGSVLYVGDVTEKNNFSQYQVIEAGDKTGAVIRFEKD